MKEKFSYTKGRLIGFLCCALLPLLATVLGIVLLVSGVMFNRGIGFTYFLIESIALGLLALCIFSRSKTWVKALLSVVILILFLAAFYFGLLFAEFTWVTHYEGDKVEPPYHAAIGEHTLMPDLSQIGQPSHLTYNHIHAEFFIFTSETDYLICQYEPEEYALQKAALDTAYTFQTTPIKNYDSVCAPMAEIGGYTFRMLSFDAYDTETHLIMYPKKMVLIGYSDEAREIVYLAFDDIDLDSIPSLESFIINDCGWKYIR